MEIQLRLYLTLKVDRIQNIFSSSHKSLLVLKAFDDNVLQWRRIWRSIGSFYLTHGNWYTSKANYSTFSSFYNQH